MWLVKKRLQSLSHEFCSLFSSFFSFLEKAISLRLQGRIFSRKKRALAIASGEEKLKTENITEHHRKEPGFEYDRAVSFAGENQEIAWAWEILEIYTLWSCGTIMKPWTCTGR